VCDSAKPLSRRLQSARMYGLVVGATLRTAQVPRSSRSDGWGTMIECQRPEPTVAAVRSSPPHPLLSQGLGCPTTRPGRFAKRGAARWPERHSPRDSGIRRVAPAAQMVFAQAAWVRSRAALRTKSDTPLKPRRRAVSCNRNFSSAVRRTFTCTLRAPVEAGAGGLCPCSSMVATA